MMSTDRSSTATGPANEEGPKKRLRWRLLATAGVNLPRGLLAGTLAALVLTWGMFALNPGAWPGLVSPLAQSAVYLALVVVTARSRRVKVLIVRTVQRWTLNPLMRLLLRVGVNPLGLAILETRGRVSGRPRRTPVGNGRQGSTFWIIAEHGARAGYVRNIQAGPAGPGAATSRMEVSLGARNRRDRARRRRARPPTPHHPLAPPARAQRDQRARPRRRPAQRAGEAAA